MKVGVIGHSYVRDLQRLDYSNLVYGDLKVPINYFAFPGFGYRNFILNPSLLDSLVEYHPEVTVIFLGGNDIKEQVDLNCVKSDCEKFFSILKLRLPDSKFVVSHVEIRHLEETNSHGTPSADLYKKLARNFNKWLDRQPFKYKTLLVNGASKLDNPKFFRSDRVHLNKKGLELLLELLYNCLLDIVGQ